MPTPQKEAFVADMHGRLQESKAVFLADFTGVNVNQNQRLRAALHEAGVSMTVVKNRLFKLALEGTEFAGVMDEHLTGPNAVMLLDDVAGGAKALKQFLKEAEDVPFSIKGGALPETPLSAQEIETLATLPSREELIGMFAGMLQRPLGDFARLLNSPLRDFAGVLAALESEKSES